MYFTMSNHSCFLEKKKKNTTKNSKTQPAPDINNTTQILIILR